MKKIKIFVLMMICVLTVGVLFACKKDDTESTSEPSTEENSTDATTEEETSTVEESTTASNGLEDGKIPVYVGNDDASGLETVAIEVDELTPEILVEALIKNGVLEEGTKVIRFEIEGDLGILDLSAVPVLGTSGESVVLGAIGNTFIEAYQVEKIRLLINGNNYESGHIIFGDNDFLYYQK